MVLLFHGGFSWLSGGYFGVSIFFTLSGFLITSLLIAENQTMGRISPGAFYSRRIRRLLPASLVCLSAVCVLGLFGVWRGVGHLRRDALGALFQVSNWVQLASGESYADLQSKRAGLVSPLAHYWSLAIEEQFYWAWPLIFLSLARLARRRHWQLSSIMGVLTICLTMATPVIASVAGPDAAYWATPARAAELLVGAWLAAALAGRRVQPRSWMAPIGASAAVAIALTLPAAGGPAYHGAFPLFAVFTGLLLLGLQGPGRITSALSVRPLVALGKISYGVYLYHFPIFLLLTTDRTGVSGIPLFSLRIVATLISALCSYLLIERPIRVGRPTGIRIAGWSTLATAAVVVLAIILPTTDLANYYRPNSAVAAAAAIQPIDGLGQLQPLGPPVANATAVTEQPPTTIANASPDTTIVSTVPPRTLPSTPTAVRALNRPVRIVVVGDSTAEALGTGMIEWAASNPEFAQVDLEALPGCAFVRGGRPKSEDSFVTPCIRLLDDTLPDALVDLQPDVVMLMVTVGDVLPRQWNAKEGLITPVDPRYATRMHHDYQALTDLILSASAARIVWIRPPAADPYWMGAPYLDPQLLDIRDNVTADIISATADRSQLLDLRQWMEADGIAFDHDARPDGLHLTPEAARYVTETWLGPSLMSAVAAPTGFEPVPPP